MLGGMGAGEDGDERASKRRRAAEELAAAQDAEEGGGGRRGAGGGGGEPQASAPAGGGAGGGGEATACPYLHTVTRTALDFDFEKCCSVSLSPLNVYACLVCGKYFAGRGRDTHAYTHSLEETHHVFMNLATGRTYCLPDGYEVRDPSLEDVRFMLNPRFTAEQVRALDSGGGGDGGGGGGGGGGGLTSTSNWSRRLDGTEFLPGTVGLNNLRSTDYVNVVVQALVRVAPLRDFFLLNEGMPRNPSLLLQRFGELVRKVWNRRNYKGQVSPHEFMQAVQLASKKRFVLDAQGDPVEFLTWLLHTLHRDLGGSKKPRSSIVARCFQGQLVVTTEAAGDGGAGPVDEDVPFYMLSLDLPPAPLFQDAMEKNVIPQVPLFDILKKYDGDTWVESVRGPRKRFRLKRLPQFLVLNVRRFARNNFFVEKNPTIVTFPVRNLELADAVPVAPLPSGEPQRSKYDLLANVCHDGKPGEGAYRAQVLHRAEATWFDVQDLAVEEILPQQVPLTETCLQLYERHGGPAHRRAGGFPGAS